MAFQTKKKEQRQRQHPPAAVDQLGKPAQNKTGHDVPGVADQDCVDLKLLKVNVQSPTDKAINLANCQVVELA